MSLICVFGSLIILSCGWISKTCDDINMNVGLCPNKVIMCWLMVVIF